MILLLTWLFQVAEYVRQRESSRQSHGKDEEEEEEEARASGDDLYAGVSANSL